jgi:hypothetical protein
MVSPPVNISGMADTLALAAALLPDYELSLVEQLGGSSRSDVVRLRAVGPDGQVQTLIAKAYKDPGQEWQREPAALSVLPDGVPAPRLVAAAAGATPTVVMTDLGGGPSVADALLGDDPHFALAALRDWVTSLAQLHVSTVTFGPAFAAALGRYTGRRLPVSMLSDATRGTRERLTAVATELGVTVPAGGFDELATAIGRLHGNGAVNALTPADACPDNNIITSAGVALIDFESAQWRHIAWDVAYLDVPWPSCWCAWALPGPVVAELRAHYRKVAGDALPYVRADAFDADVAAAAATWAIVSVSWFLSRSMIEDLDPAPGPRRRIIILHRLKSLAAHRDWLRLADFAGRLRARLVREWGELDLGLAPAFR